MKIYGKVKNMRRFLFSRTQPTEQRRTVALPQPPIYLISMAGFPNFGDELITARWLTYLAEKHPDTDIWLDVREPGTASSLFKGLHPKLHVTNTIFRAMHEHIHGLNRSPAELVRDLGSPRFDAGLQEIRNAGTIHLLGGGFIHSIWPENTQICEAMRAAREISGATLVATGQGLMPRVNENFEGFSHVSVRDQPSATSLGVDRGFDDAYLIDPRTMPPRPASEFHTEELELFVCVQNDMLAPGRFEEMIDFTRRQIEAFDIPRERVRYVEAIPGDDYAGYDALRDYIADDGFIPFHAFWVSNFQFAPRQVWLTTRFHHHLVGALYGARGVALNGQPGYYDVKHGSLIDSGTRWRMGGERIFSLDELQAPDSFAHQVASKRFEADSIYGS